MWNRDEVEGKAGRLKGKIKNEAGELMDNERLRREGAEEEGAGAAQETIGKARRKLGETIEKVGENIKK